MAEEMRHTLRNEEIRDLAWTTLGLGVAFAIWEYGTGAASPTSLLSAEFAGLIGIATVLVAMSYIPHAMAHRVTARSMDAYAEYRIWHPGIVLAILTSFLGVVFAAAGGTRIYTRTGERYGLTQGGGLTVKTIGLISVIGPLINISLAVLFAFIAVSVQDLQVASVDLHYIFRFGSNINSFLAIANLLPFYPLDGYKILRWNTSMWAISLVLAGLTFLLV